MNKNIIPIEIRKQIIRDFIHFLKSKNIYVEYRTNIAKAIVYQCSAYKYYMAFFYGLKEKILLGNLANLSYNHALNLINYAFIWSSTKQGHFLWAELHMEWANYFLKNYKQHELLLNRK